MRRTSLSLVFLFGSHLAIEAQILIPKVGISYSRAFSPEDTDVLTRETTFKSGFLVGFAVEAPLSSSLVLETGFLYVQKGNKMTEKGKGSFRYNSSRHYVLEFLEIPVLLKYKFDKGNIILYPLAGISASYGVGGTINGTLETVTTDGQVVDGTFKRKIHFGENEAGQHNATHPGAPLDLGVQIGVDALLFDNVNIALRYSRGFKQFKYENGLSGCNQSIQFHAGIPVKLVSRAKIKTSEEETPADRSRVRVYTGFSVGERVSTFQGSEADFRLEDSPDSYFRKRRTVTYGFDFKVELNRYVFLRSGVYSIENGAAQVRGGFSYPFQAEIRYISLPMLFGVQPLNLSNVGSFNLAVEGGVAGNWELEGEKEGLTADLHPDLDIKMKKFLVSAQVGMTLEVRISAAVMLCANYRLARDIAPFFKRSVGENDFELFNKGTSLHGGAIFKVK